jgi:signal transduction histidine kinase/DNA-binding response OmpR family regulator
MLNLIDSAKFYYKQSLDMAIHYNVVDNIITGYYNLGDLAFLNKQYSDAIFYFKKAEANAETEKKDVLKLAVYSSLSESYKLLGDYKSAFIYKAKQFELNNSIFQLEKQKTIDELQIKYEATKKEKEIQRQKRLVEQSKLIAQQKQSTYNFILFIVILSFIIVLFIFFYLGQRKRAKQVLEHEKMRLFENIVHEIRTPLTLINGPLQLIKKEIDTNNDLGEHVQLIENNASKLVYLVNELLDTSKLERGKYIPAFEYGDINFFTEKLLASFEREAKNKNITIEFEPLTTNVLHSYPLNVIEKVITNLVSNAIKYCPNSRTVKITLKLIDNRFIIYVKDNGLGIPKKEQKRIFKRFYRLKAHKDFTGTGIGLSLVKELVELVKGTITVDSIPNIGTTFEVIIPIDLSEKSEEKIEIDENKPYLLLVEDNHEIVKFVSRLFRDEFNVITAYNGDEGVKKVNSLLPDVVLTDIMMPIKDGIELIQEVKGSELTSHIPVVVFSAKASLESRLEGLKHGADAYFPKPFNTDELILTVQNLLSTNKSAQQEFQEELKMKKSFEERTKSKNDYINEAIRFIVHNLEDVNYSVNELANDMCISRSQLHRKLKVLTGFSSTNFIRMIRLEKARDLLESNWGNVTEIAYHCGFSSQSYFTKSFTEYFGQNPTYFSGK